MIGTRASTALRTQAEATQQEGRTRLIIGRKFTGAVLRMKRVIVAYSAYLADASNHASS